MSSFQFILVYFGNLLPWLVVVFITGLSVLAYSFFRNSSQAKTRSRSLGVMFCSSIFFWSFIGASLILCFFLTGAYEYDLQQGVRSILGYALLVSFMFAVPLSVFIRNATPQLILRRLGQALPVTKEVQGIFRNVAEKFQLNAEVLSANVNAPVCFALDGEQKAVLVSPALLRLLSEDELEGVFAHELAHLKNRDSMLKALASVYRSIMPFDPILRLVEPAFHRERELVADEIAAKVTGKPLALTSALVKIQEAFQVIRMPSKLAAFSIAGNEGGIFNRHPILSRRVARLAELANQTSTVQV